MSKSSERVPISKRKRFNLFERDKFTCQYCGKQPPSVRLVIDHRVPVSEGGHSEDDNLVTSCEECNQGKASRIIGPGGVPEHQDTRSAQERLEIIQAAELASLAAEARERLRTTICNYYCDLTGDEALSRQIISTLTNLVYEFDFETVAQWMDTASSNVMRDDDWSPNQFVAYVCGCARNHRKGSA